MLIIEGEGDRSILVVPYGEASNLFRLGVCVADLIIGGLFPKSYDS